MKEFTLIFTGYYSDLHRDAISEESGVYLVFVGKPLLNKTVNLEKLIYIGQGENLKERICKHDKHDKFLQQCEKGELPYYAYALVSKSELDIVENALIFYNKPCLNGDLTWHYNHTDSVRLSMSGQCHDLFGSTICIDVRTDGSVNAYAEELVDE